jgi:rod shape-determining protein MreD
VKKILLPLLFVFLFLLESLFVQYLPDKVFGQNWILVPRFLFSALIFLTIFVGKKKGILYAAIFGLLFDVVYVEIIGIYFFLFPFICYLVSKLMHLWHNNFIIAFFVTISAVALLEMGTYELDHLIHVANLDFMSFLNLRFYPSLLLNAVFLLIFGYPLKRYFENYAETLSGE